jgi:hypothetical protein
MEVTLFLLSIVPCFALVMGQPVAPMDADNTCRTNFMFRPAHDWIPYVNDTSDGVRGQVKWQVLLDQFDYENLIGPGPWEPRDVDGDSIQVCVLTFTSTKGKILVWWNLSIIVACGAYRNQWL